jgi:hypothetical protein
MHCALSLRDIRTISVVVLLAGIGLLTTPPVTLAQQQIVAGQNVNMVGGPWSFDPATGRIIGDPFLQRQNEPSLALSSRNPCHILSGANDYRAVDVPGLPADMETGDAWLGLYKSIDCGQTWTSTLLPGYPQDKSAEGMASPIKGLPAGADATVRPGPAGMVYYSGVAFDRGSKNLGKVFVSRFVDSNNKEQGDPFVYLGTAQIESGTAGQFLDKPWIAADIPRNGGTCTVDGKVIPAGNVYITYTSFTGGSNNPRSKIMFSASSDCGATWSNPSKLSEQYALNQGTVMAISPVDGSISIAWRGFGDSTTPGGILFARSTDGGKSFTKAAYIDSALYPFDQGSSAVSFRTNAYPAMAIDGTGRIYVAWGARGYSGYSPDPVSGDARIVMSTSSDGGATWSLPRAVVDNYPGPGHQIMPALTFAAGKLVIAYYDFREDESDVYGKYVDESQVVYGSGRRHTIELRAAMADPASAPVFTDYTTMQDNLPSNPSARVTRYLSGNYGSTRGVQLQYNPPNLPIFAKGTTPFIGDYIDIAGQTFTIDASSHWTFNTAASGTRVPMFHVAWADNRDVRKPPPGQTWASYKSPTLGPSGLICDSGTNPGSRNQNLYTAPLMPGLLVTAPGNQKTVNQSLGIQRAFVVFAKNATSQDRYYTLSLPALPTGVYASFRPIDETKLTDAGGPPLSSQLGPILIPRRSSIARSVYVLAPGVASPQVTVNVTEANTPVGATPATASVVLNPDIANPDIANPDIANPDIANPDIANAEVYNPDIANPDIANPDIANPDIANPDIANPDIANPDIANSTLANPDIANPDIANPDIANPDIANPDIANPDIANPDIANYSVTDISWSVTNKGNTTAAYAFRAKLTRDLPPGAKLQLIVRRVYVAPQASMGNACGEPQAAIQNQVLVNIPNPTVSSSLTTSFDPGQYADNASFFLLPSAQGRVTLRVYCPKGAACPTPDQASSLAAARVVSQAPNNCPAGSTFANCAVNGNNPDDIYDVTAPVTGCSVTGGGTTKDCSQGPFYFSGSATVALAPADGVGVKTTSCTIDGAPCSSLSVPVSGAGAHQVTFYSEDYSGNVEAARTVNVTIDTAAPVVSGISFPAGAAVGGWISAASVSGTVAANDSTPLTVSCTDSIAGGTAVSGLTITVSGDGSHVLGCTVTDRAGNATTVNATVNLDTGNPTVTVPTVVVTAEATGPTTKVSFTASGADTLSGATVACTPASGSTFAIGDTTVSCTATDGAGNKATASFAVHVKDTTPPAIALNGVSPMTVEAGSVFQDPGATAVDLVDGVVPVASAIGVQTGALGAYSVVYTAADSKGNSAAAVRSVVVVDTTAPALTLPATIFAEAASAAGAAVTYSASATDLIGGTLPATCVPSSGATFPVGSTTVNCSAVDSSGNTGKGSFTVTVRDTTAPAVTVPGPIVAEATGPLGAAVAFSASATDSVSGSLATTCVPASGSTFPLGATTVTCTASDSGGNTGTASFSITVSDTTAPVLKLPAPITVNATSLAGATVAYTATATDLVDGSVVPVCTPASGSVFAIGTTAVNCTATDRVANRSVGSFNVTVQLQYGFVNIKNLPPPSGTKFNLGSSIPLSWQWTLGGKALDTADSRPLITITGPSGSATFTPESPGASSFQYSTTTFTWQFNWQTKGLVAGSYTVTITCRKTGQTFSGGVIQLK